MEKRELAFNFKALMMFEKLSGESYFNINEVNYVFLLYAMYMVKHPYLNMTLIDFANIFGSNKKVTKQLLTEFEEYMVYIRQFTSNNKTDVVDEEGEDAKNAHTTITDIVMYLITACGIDPHYVMYEMELWEIEPYMKFAEMNKKESLEMDRLWTYLNISPHIDTKKCKSPDKLLPFPWEKEEHKKKAEQELKNNEYAIKNMIGKSIFGEQTETPENNE